MHDVETMIRIAGFGANDEDLATSGLCGTFALALKTIVPHLELNLVCCSDASGGVLRCRDGDPAWRHVVSRDQTGIYDVGGRVALDDLVANYCWGNPHSAGGHLLTIEREALILLLHSDRKSFDAGYLRRWISMLEASLHHLHVRELRHA